MTNTKTHTIDGKIAPSTLVLRAESQVVNIPSEGDEIVEIVHPLIKAILEKMPFHTELRTITMEDGFTRAELELIVGDGNRFSGISESNVRKAAIGGAYQKIIDDITEYYHSESGYGHGV